MIQKGRCSHWSSLQAEAAALEAQKRAVCCHFWLRTCWVGCVQSSGFHLQQERRPERGGAASRWLMVPLPPDPSAAGIWFGRATVCPWPSWWDSPALGSGFDCSCWGRALPGIEEGCRIAGAAGGGGTTGGSVPGAQGSTSCHFLSLARGVSGAVTHLALRSCSCPLAWIPFLGAMLQARRTLCALVGISCRGLLGTEPPWGRR